MKIVVVGSGGRLGAALARRYRESGEEIFGFNHAALDLADDAALRSTLEPLGFEMLINCAALTNVDYCEAHAAEAHRLNAEAVRTIAEICARKKARCVHISTDYVFDGEKGSAYVEEDAARPLSVYAASKRAGEVALLAVSEEHLVVRVSWVFGPDRPSFVDGILNKALTSAESAAIADKQAVPTFTLDAAELLRPFLGEIRVGGILHLCHAGGCSWQEYGQFALDCARRAGAPLQAEVVAPLKMAEMKAFIARRPANTVMSTAWLTALSGQQPRSWQEAVEDYVVNHWLPAVRARGTEG